MLLFDLYVGIVTSEFRPKKRTIRQRQLIIRPERPESGAIVIAKMRSVGAAPPNHCRKPYPDFRKHATQQTLLNSRHC